MAKSAEIGDMMFQPSLPQSPDRVVVLASCHELERSGWNIGAINTKVTYQLAKKDKDMALSIPDCKMTEVELFQPSLRQITMNIYIQEARPGAILPGDLRAG